MSGLRKTPYDTAASELLTLEARRQKITHVELARRTGFPLVSVGRYLRGESPMTVSTFRALLRELDVPSSDALNRVDDLNEYAARYH